MPLLVVEFWSGLQEQRQAVDAAQQRVAATADVIAAGNAQLAEGFGQLLAALGASPVVSGDDPAACHAYFKRLIGLEAGFRHMGFINLQGELVCNATDPAANLNLVDRDYFVAALKSEGMVAGATMVGRLTGQRSIAFARRMVDAGGTVVGVVYVTRDAGTLVGTRPGQVASPLLQVQLLDRSGAVLQSNRPDPATLFLPVADPVLLRAVLAHQGDTWNGAIPDATPDTLRVLRPVRLDERDLYYVAVTANVDSITAPAMRVLLWRLSAIVVIALLVAVLAWWLSQRTLVRPVERLVRDIRRLGTGNFSPPDPLPGMPLDRFVEIQQSLGGLAGDLRQLRQSQEQTRVKLADEAARFLELFEANPQIMWFYEASTLRFLSVNRAARHFYGYTGAEFQRMTLLDIRPPSEHALLRQRVAQHHPALRQRTPRIWTHQLRSGETRQMEVVYHTTRLGGQQVELAMATDVTQRLAAELALCELNETLAHRVAEHARELKRLNQELQSFAAVVSQELGKPADALALCARELREHLTDGTDGTGERVQKGQQCLARVEQSVQAVQQLTDELLARTRSSGLS